MQIQVDSAVTKFVVGGASTDKGSFYETRLEVCDCGDPGRAEAESFIRNRFSAVYGAQVQQQMPRLLTIHNQQGLIAALGIRQAADQPLFLEQYLEMPVERSIAAYCEYGVQRAKIVEIGSLALASAGQARIAIPAVTAYLCGAGIDWVVFTAVTSLRNAFQRLGLTPHYLADADAACLGVKAVHWGRYYQAHPQVYAGHVRQGAANLESCLFQPGAQSQRRLWLQAYLSGLCHS